MKKIMYISGKITGIEKEAPALFEAAEKEVIEMGFEPLNPMKLPSDHDRTWNSYMKECLAALRECDEVYMLDNWHMSKGALIEAKLAHSLEMPIHFQSKNSNCRKA